MIEKNITWVASHQDDLVDDTTYLTILAQFNIQAGELATKGLNQLAPKPYVPIDPTIIVQLNHIRLIPDVVRSYTNNNYPGTITSNIKPTVWRIITTPKIIAALQKRFDWDDV